MTIIQSQWIQDRLITNQIDQQLILQTKYQMCSCPLPCLKAIVGIGALISIIISIGLLALTIYANLEKRDIIDNIAGKTLNDYLLGLYLASTVFMLLGICGLYGAIKSRKKMQTAAKCLLGFYFIGVILFFLIFTAATIFFFIGPQIIFGSTCEHGAKTQLVDQLYAVNNKAISQFCSKQCECYVDMSAQGGSQFGALLTENGYYFTTSNTSRNNYQSCLTQQSAKDPNILLMSALEELLSCTGWCSNEKLRFKRFSDINSCLTDECLKNSENCHAKFQSFLKGQGKLLGFGCSIATAICLINLITICCICFHPSKKSNSNFYDKMMDDQ